MSENIFDKRRLKTFSNCQDLVKSMVGTKDGIIGYNEHFRLDLENTCYKANMYEDLWKENQQLKKQYCERTDCSGRIKDSKKYDSLQQRIDKAIEEIDKYLLTEDYCSLKCENLADTFYKLSEILKGKCE